MKDPIKKLCEEQIGAFEKEFKKTQCNCVLNDHKKNEDCPSRTSYYEHTPEDIKAFLRTSQTQLIEAVRAEERERIMNSIKTIEQGIEIGLFKNDPKIILEALKKTK